jgi:hypothetical protein
MKHPTPPNNEFVLITDNQGNIVDHYPEHCVIDDIFRRIQVLDSEIPGDSPHSLWKWYIIESQSCLGRFIQVHERVGKDPPPTNSGSSQ